MAQNLATALVNANLDVLETEILPLINEDFAKIAATEALQRIRLTADALLDDVADNQSQVSAIWANLGSDPEIVDALTKAFVHASELVDDEKVAAILKVLTTPIAGTIAALTDGVKPNADQIKVLWLAFLASDEFRQILVQNLELVIRSAIKNQSLENLVVKILNVLD